MFAQVLEFKERPQAEVMQDTAIAIGHFIYNLKCLGVRHWTKCTLRDGLYRVTMTAKYAGRDIEVSGVSGRDHSHAYLNAIEQLHGSVVTISVFNQPTSGMPA